MAAATIGIHLLLAATGLWFGELEQAQELIAKERFVEARPLLEHWLAAHPDDVTALCWLAFAEVTVGDATATLATTARATELAPLLAAPWYHRGRAQLLLHDFAAADRAFGTCERLDATFFPAWRHHFQALAALGSGDEPRARQLYTGSPEATTPWAHPAFLFERMATLYSIVPEPEPARGWYRRADAEYFAGERLLSAYELALPVHGEWLVGQGSHGEVSHFGIAGSFSCDLLRLEGGKWSRDGGVRREESFTWNAAVEAPADVEVVRVVDDFVDHQATAADLAPLSAPAVRFNPLGNHVVLRLAPDAWLLLAHLRHGSVVVQVGERVKAGREIGRVGQTGVSYAPHLHLTLWSSLDPPISRPLRFVATLVRHADGTRTEEPSCSPMIGDIVQRK